MKQADGVVVTFDVTDQASFDAVDTFMSLMKGNAASDIPRVLVGTKMDKTSERVISFDKAQKKANEHFYKLYVEVSAKENWNVSGAIKLLTSEIIFNR